VWKNVRKTARGGDPTRGPNGKRGSTYLGGKGEDEGGKNKVGRFQSKLEKKKGTRWFFSITEKERGQWTFHRKDPFGPSSGSFEILGMGRDWDGRRRR